MEINYLTIGIVVLAAVLLILFLIQRNKKDQKAYEEDKIKSELKPGKHDQEHA